MHGLFSAIYFPVVWATKMYNVFCNIVANELNTAAMLRVLSPKFKPVNNQICCKIGLIWVVKPETSLFNSFSSNVARQVACFTVP